MGNLKNTTKADLATALKAAQEEISGLANRQGHLNDLVKGKARQIDSLTADLKAANDLNQQLQADMELAVRAAGELGQAKNDLEADLKTAKDQLADFEAVGITQDVVDSPVNLSALRRLLDASEQDEPVFVLRARDRVAPQVVEWWASEAVKAGATNHRKLGQALARAAEMRRWAEAHGNRIPD